MQFFLVSRFRFRIFLRRFGPINQPNGFAGAVFGAVGFGPVNRHGMVNQQITRFGGKSDGFGLIVFGPEIRDALRKSERLGPSVRSNAVSVREPVT